MSHKHSSPYERPTDFKDRYIQSLEDQISLHKKHQQTHDAQVKGLYGRIAHLESMLRAAECSHCYKPSHGGHKMVCEGCLSKIIHEQQIIVEKNMEGPACDSCRVRKRRCDRQKPHCSHCTKLHRNQPGLPNCTYPDKKRKTAGAEEWPTTMESAHRKGPTDDPVTPNSPPRSTRSNFSPSISNLTNM